MYCDWLEHALTPKRPLVGQLKKRAITNKGKVSPHPSVAKFEKKYPTVGHWIAANPGVSAARFISAPCSRVIYFVSGYSDSAGIRSGGWVYANRPDDMPRSVNGFMTVETYEEWAKMTGAPSMSKPADFKAVEVQSEPIRATPKTKKRQDLLDYCKYVEMMSGMGLPYRSQEDWLEYRNQKVEVVT